MAITKTANALLTGAKLLGGALMRNKKKAIGAAVSTGLTAMWGKSMLKDNLAKSQVPPPQMLMPTQGLVNAGQPGIPLNPKLNQLQNTPMGY